jgi:hypothetical protein
MHHMLAGMISHPKHAEYNLAVRNLEKIMDKFDLLEDS